MNHAVGFENVLLFQTFYLFSGWKVNAKNVEFVWVHLGGVFR